VLRIPLSRFDLVGKVQEIDERHHEHPHQIDEVPIKPKDFDIIGVIAAALIA
jgi:hypothetical protein